MASSYVGGLSGAFIPVSEDQGMIDAVNDGALTLEKLEAMTCVCSVGLDMIAIPGDTKATTISGIIADEMAIGMINQKTTACRLLPAIGKDVYKRQAMGIKIVEKEGYEADDILGTLSVRAEKADVYKRQTLYGTDCIFRIRCLADSRICCLLYTSH